MPRTCTICSHEKRAEIDEKFVSGMPYRGIAKLFGCSEAAMYRHTAEHIADSIQQSQVAKEESRGLDVVQQLKYINGVTLDILKKARNDKKDGMALFAIDRVMKQIELQAKLLGAIDTPQINIYVTPEWKSIREKIVYALMPYPDARVAVAGALSELEHSHAGLN